MKKRHNLNIRNKVCILNQSVVQKNRTYRCIAIQIIHITFPTVKIIKAKHSLLVVCYYNKTKESITVTF